MINLDVKESNAITGLRRLQDILLIQNDLADILGEAAREMKDLEKKFAEVKSERDTLLAALLETIDGKITGELECDGDCEPHIHITIKPIIDSKDLSAILREMTFCARTII